MTFVVMHSYFFVLPQQLHNCVRFFTTSWGYWEHAFWIPGARPMFLKPKLHEESKNGFKTISCRPYPVMIFSKNCFWCKKIIKKIRRFDDFWTFMAMYMITLHQFKKKLQEAQNQLKYYQNVKNWSIFSYVTLLGRDDNWLFWTHFWIPYAILVLKT